MRNRNTNNGHHGIDSRLHSITSHVVMPDGKPFSGNNTPRNGRKSNHSDEGQRAKSSGIAYLPIDFRAFSDGTLVELVRDPSDLRPRLLIWKNGKATIEDEFRHADCSFVPPDLERSLAEATRLPTAISPNATLEDLLQKTQKCVSTYVDLQPQYVRLVSNFVLYTWFADRLTVAPYLWITGPCSAGKTKLLRLMHCLCRRAVLVSDISPASFYLLPNAIKPTLLIDEFEPGTGGRYRELEHYLRCGSTQDGRAIRGGKLYDTFGPKVIASRVATADGALASRAVFISMMPTSRFLRELDRSGQEAIANQLQGQFLRHRLENYSRPLSDGLSKRADFVPRMRDLARALAAPLFGHQQFEQLLIEDLQPQNEGAKLSLHGEPEWVVATALFAQSHHGGVFTVGDLTSDVNELLEKVGETYFLNPRAVGNYLRSLGFSPLKLGSTGRGFRMTQQLARQVHKLATDLGIKRADIVYYQALDNGWAGKSCSLCDEYGLLVREDGTKLRTEDPFKEIRERGSARRAAQKVAETTDVDQPA
jgi:hypothetical protein